jgi:hypothetical protein
MLNFYKHSVLKMSKLLMIAVLFSIVSALVFNHTLTADIDLTEIVEMDFDEEDPNEDDVEPEGSDLIFVIQTKSSFDYLPSLNGAGVFIQLVQQSLKRVPTPPPDLV